MVGEDLSSHLPPAGGGGGGDGLKLLRDIDIIIIRGIGDILLLLLLVLEPRDTLLLLWKCL